VATRGTLYNPLSNSRWNLPYYSFNQVIGGVGVQNADVVYGPSTCDGAPPPTGNCTAGSNVPVTFTGAPTNPNQGPAGQAQAQGNITGWDPSNPNQATLTGIIFPKGIKDPYVLQLLLQRAAGNYAQDRGCSWIMLAPPVTSCSAQRTSTASPALTCLLAFTLPTTSAEHGLEEWSAQSELRPPQKLQNSVNSNYNSLQASLKHQMSHGLLFNVNYTYSHSIDNGSTWHSGATTANGRSCRRGLHSADDGMDRSTRSMSSVIRLE